MKQLLLLETIAPEAHKLLAKHAHITFLESEAEALKHAQEQPVHAIVTRGKGRVNAPLIHACKDLAVVARCGVGLDNIDVETANKQGIPVVNTPGVNAATVAEHTLSLMLMLMRRMHVGTKLVKDGQWAARNEFVCDELNGKTLGILGLGDIGKRVATLAEAFGMRIVFWDKFAEHDRYEKRELEGVLEAADILTLHLPLLPDTRNLLGPVELSLMKPGAYLINTARGQLINQASLLAALDGDKLAGFGADVLAVEPPSYEDPIWWHEKTLITPHVASLTITTFRNICMRASEAVAAILKGEQPDPKYVFNREALQQAT